MALTIIGGVKTRWNLVTDYVTIEMADSMKVVGPGHSSRALAPGAYGEWDIHVEPCYCPWTF